MNSNAIKVLLAHANLELDQLTTCNKVREGHNFIYLTDGWANNTGDKRPARVIAMVQRFTIERLREHISDLTTLEKDVLEKERLEKEIDKMSAIESESKKRIAELKPLLAPLNDRIRDKCTSLYSEKAIPKESELITTAKIVADTNYPINATRFEFERVAKPSLKRPRDDAPTNSSTQTPAPVAPTGEPPTKKARKE